MAKKKRQRKAPSFRRQRSDERVVLALKELGTGFMTVLVNDYGWTPEAADKLFAEALTQSRETRKSVQAQMAVQVVLNKGQKN